jgi:hypothetical protein
MRPSFATVYWALSGSLLDRGSLAIGAGSQTAFEPLYPVFLAVSRILTGDHVFLVQLLQIAVASMGAVCLYQLTLTLSGSRRAATLSALVYSVYPLLVRQASSPSESALFTTLLILFALLFVRIAGIRDAAVAGACLGLAILTRTMVVPLALAGAAILIAHRRQAAAATFGLVAVAIVLPYLIRNHAIDGSWWPTRSGINLYIGNSPYTTALLPDYDLDLLQPVAYSIVRQARPDLTPDSAGYDHALDAFLTKRAFAYLEEQPLRTLGEKIRNIWYFCSPRIVPYELTSPETHVVISSTGQPTVENSIPRPRAEIFAYAVSSSFVLVAAIFGVAIRRRDIGRDAILFAIVGTFVAVNVLYVPATRYRAPMEFVLFFYAAVALDYAVSRTDPRVKRHRPLAATRDPGDS